MYFSFTFTAKHFRGKVPAIYNVVVGVREQNNPDPTLSNFLKGVGVNAEMYIERIPLEEVPENDEDAAMWLHKLYQKRVIKLPSLLKMEIKSNDFYLKIITQKQKKIIIVLYCIHEVLTS